MGTVGSTSTALIITIIAAAVSATPALAHQGWSGDPAHLLDDLLVTFGLPLAVLAIGALVGVGLSVVLSRRDGEAPPADAAADEAPGEEPVAGPER